jgi:hypothetical protein
VGVGLALAAVFGCVAAALILSGFDHGRGASDQLNYHGRVIATFAQQWPGPDLRDYLSMTTPGYHLALAVVAVYVTDSAAGLQLAGLVFSLALIVLLAWGVARRVSMTPLRTLSVCFPLVCSLYVLSAGVWLLPDNAAWLGVLGILLIALRPRVDAWTYVGGGAVLLALVFVRQVHLWAAAPLWMAAWLGAGGVTSIKGMFADPTPVASVRRAVVCGVCTLPAFVLVALFVRHWGGELCPPSFVNWTRPPGRPVRMTPGATAFILALIGVASSFFVAYWWPGFVRLVRGRWWILAAAAAGGLVAGLAVPTSLSRPDGRYSGIWQGAAWFPTMADRSLLIAGLSSLGAALLACWCAAISTRDRIVVLTALAGFGAAQTVNPWLWQRYIEPLVLILMALLASRASRPREAPPPGPDLRRTLMDVRDVAAVGGPVLLGVLLAVSTAGILHKAPKAADWGITPGPPDQPGHVPNPPIHGQAEREFLKPGSPSPDN